jgi:hypothetical protein
VVHDALVPTDDDRADLDLSGRLGPRPRQESHRPRRRWVEAAENLFLNPIRDRARCSRS